MLHAKTSGTRSVVAAVAVASDAESQRKWVDDRRSVADTSGESEGLGSESHREKLLGRRETLGSRGEGCTREQKGEADVMRTQCASDGHDYISRRARDENR